MAKDVRFVISASVARAEEEIRRLQRTGSDVTSILTKDFEVLGVRSTLAIDKERAAAVAAFDKIKASGVSSYADIGRASQALQAKLAVLDKERGVPALSSNLKQVATEGRGVEAALGGVNNILGAMGVTLGAAGLTSLYTSARQARIEMDAISNSLSAGTQSRVLAGAEFEYVANRAQYLGLNLQRTATDYAQIVAAAKGTSLEGEATRKIFDGVTTASTALHLSAEKTSNILRALNQMMSKGTVQTEELKGQLGEALPGAYQMAAKAMGLTTAELSKQLEKGQVMASDMLPKLAAEMEKRFGKQIPEAIKSTQAEMNRLENALFKLKLTMFDSGAFSSVAKGMTGMTEGAQTLVMWTGQAKVYWGAMIDKAKVWVDAGGLIGLIKGGKGSTDELKAQFAAIDAMAEHSWNKWLEKGGKMQPTLDPATLKAKAQQEVDAKAAAEKDAAEKSKQEAEKLMKHELDAFKAHQNAKTALVREEKAIELAELKGRYDQGLIATAEYYEKEKQIALDASKQELANAEAYLKKETALLENLKGRTKKGEKDPEYVEELAKHEKAIESVTMAELKLQKTTIDEGNKVVGALRQREDAYRAQELAALDAAGQYVAAEEAKQAAEKVSVDYLRLKAEALSGVSGAIKALAALDNKRSADLVAADLKQLETARQYAEEIANLHDDVAKLNGADQDRIKLNKDLRDGLQKETQMRDKLRIAIVNNNQIEISGLNSKIALQDVLNQRLQGEIALQERKKVLSGEIVGFNNGVPIYADAYSKDQAANGYVTNAQLTGSSRPGVNPDGSVKTNYWGEPVDDSGNTVNPFGLPGISGTRAKGGPVDPYGAYLVGEKGPEIIRMGNQGGTVIPNNQLGGAISIGDINITIQGGATGTETAREIARAIYPELQKLSGRRLVA